MTFTLRKRDEATKLLQKVKQGCRCKLRLTLLLVRQRYYYV